MCTVFQYRKEMEIIQRLGKHINGASLFIVVEVCGYSIRAGERNIIISSTTVIQNTPIN